MLRPQCLSVLIGGEWRRGGWRCVRAFCPRSTQSAACGGALHTSALVSFPCKGRPTRVPLHEVCCTSARAENLQPAKQPKSGIAVRGRGVSMQAAGCLIVLPLLRPFPSALPSSQLPWEVSRGRAGPSLYHYPSITCHTPTLCWQQNFPSCPPSALTLTADFSPSWSLTPCLFFLLYDFHIFLLSICSPVSLPDWPFYLPLFTFLVVSCIFSHKLRKLWVLSLWDLLLRLQLICGSLERQRTPTAHPLLPLQTDSFHTKNSVEFWARGRLNVCQKCSANLGHTAMQYRCNVTMNILWFTTVYSSVAE